MKVKVTKTILTDDSPCPVTGRHFGTPMRNVSAKFLDWFRRQEHLMTKYPSVAAYITKYKRAIDAELENEKYGTQHFDEKEYEMGSYDPDYE